MQWVLYNNFQNDVWDNFFVNCEHIKSLHASLIAHHQEIKTISQQLYILIIIYKFNFLLDE